MIPRDDLFPHEGDTTWHARRACTGVDVNVFFPERRRTRIDIYAQAKVICATCPVADQCLDYAERNNITGGVWGGEVFDPTDGRTGRVRKPSPSKVQPITHGTVGGYTSHLRNSIPFDGCDCRQAQAAYVAEWRATRHLKVVA